MSQANSAWGNKYNLPHSLKLMSWNLRQKAGFFFFNIFLNYEKSFVEVELT